MQRSVCIEMQDIHTLYTAHHCNKIHKGNVKDRGADLEEVSVAALIERIEEGVKVGDGVYHSQDLRGVHNLGLQGHSVQRWNGGEDRVEDAGLV